MWHECRFPPYETPLPSGTDGGLKRGLVAGRNPARCAGLPVCRTGQAAQ